MYNQVFQDLGGASAYPPDCYGLELYLTYITLDSVSTTFHIIKDGEKGVNNFLEAGMPGLYKQLTTNSINKKHLTCCTSAQQVGSGKLSLG